MSKEKKPDERYGEEVAESKISPLEGVDWPVDVESKYRLVLLAAKRSKQLQKGRKPRVLARKNERDVKSLGVSGTIGISRIRSAVQEVAREALEGQSH